MFNNFRTVWFLIFICISGSCLVIAEATGNPSQSSCGCCSTDYRKISWAEIKIFMFFFKLFYFENWTISLNLAFSAEIYTSEKKGSDEFGEGTQEKPFKSILQVSHLSVVSIFLTLHSISHMYASLRQIINIQVCG